MTSLCLHSEYLKRSYVYTLRAFSIIHNFELPILNMAEGRGHISKYKHFANFLIENFDFFYIFFYSHLFANLCDGNLSGWNSIIKLILYTFESSMWESQGDTIARGYFTFFPLFFFYLLAYTAT